MTATRVGIEHLVTRIQTEFLVHSGLELTLPDAQKRFGIDETTGAGVLGALVDAGVLTLQEGRYARHFPRLAARAEGVRSVRSRSTEWPGGTPRLPRRAA